MISARGWRGLMEAVRGMGRAGLRVAELDLDDDSAVLLVALSASWEARQRVAVVEQVTGEMFPHVREHAEETAWFRLDRSARDAGLVPLITEGPSWWRRPARFESMCTDADDPTLDPTRNRDLLPGHPGPGELGLMRLEALCVPRVSFDRLTPYLHPERRVPCGTCGGGHRPGVPCPGPVLGAPGDGS